MRDFAPLLLLAAVAVAQAPNEFPDPEFEPDSLPDKVPVDTFVPSTLPIVEELINVNASTIALDKAILAFTDISGVSPALAASDDLLNTLDTATARINGIPQIANDDSNSVPDLIPYVTSLSYHVNHTVNNLVVKKQLAAQFCEGPTVLEAIIQTQTRAVAFNDTVTNKINSEFQFLVFSYTDPIIQALSSASAAFADQTTTLAGCTSTTSGGTTGPTDGTTSSTLSSTTEEPTSTTGEPTSATDTTSEGPTYGPGPTDVPTYGPGPTSQVPTYGTQAPTSSGKPYPTACKSRRRRARRAEKQL